MSLRDRANERRAPFARLLGMVFTDVTPDKIEAEMTVSEDMTTPRETAHGGVLMSFADTTGAIATIVNMPEGYSTTTIESKTNFVRPAPVGQIIKAVCTPVHKGRTTMVWRTDIFREDGKLVAVVTQTQMVIPPKEA